VNFVPWIGRPALPAGKVALRRLASFFTVIVGMCFRSRHERDSDLFGGLSTSLINNAWFSTSNRSAEATNAMAAVAARKWSDAFFARKGAMPSQIRAGVYSAVRHYLQAVKDAD
jgi:hypothetical protein